MGKKDILKDPEFQKIIEENRKVIEMSGQSIISIKKEIEILKKENREINRQISLLL